MFSEMETAMGLLSGRITSPAEIDEASFLADYWHWDQPDPVTIEYLRQVAERVVIRRFGELEERLDSMERLFERLRSI